MNEESFRENTTNKLRALEQHLINLIFPIQEISKILTHPEKINELLKILGKPLVIDDSNFRLTLNELLLVKKQFLIEVQNIDLQKTLSEIKYIGMRLKLIEEDIAKLKDEGLTRKVKLDFTCDGYELVKKPKIYEVEKEVPEIFDDPNEILEQALSILTDIEVKILMHRYGLFGEKKKTLKATGALLGYKSGQSARIIQLKALRKLRYSTSINKIKSLPECELRKDVTGD